MEAELGSANPWQMLFLLGVQVLFIHCFENLGSELNVTSCMPGYLQLGMQTSSAITVGITAEKD